MKITLALKILIPNNIRMVISDPMISLSSPEPCPQNWGIKSNWEIALRQRDYISIKGNTLC